MDSVSLSGWIRNYLELDSAKAGVFNNVSIPRNDCRGKNEKQ
jgi:hypothetical protein